MNRYLPFTAILRNKSVLVLACGRVRAPELHGGGVVAEEELHGALEHPTRVALPRMDLPIHGHVMHLERFAATHRTRLPKMDR